MMTQEEFMDVLAMRRQGMSYVEIGEELGYLTTLTEISPDLLTEIPHL